jgi:uncharacterized membrane protein
MNVMWDMRRKKWIFIAPIALLAMVAIAFIGGTIVQLLWNWLLPSLFGWRQITFWEAFGLLVLCRILFGRTGHMGSRSNMRRRIEERVEQRMADRWDRMTPEERERFRQGVRSRYDACSPAGDRKDNEGATL